MQELTTVSTSSSLTTSTQPSPINLAQPLLTALGWKDLKPAIVAAEQADQALALELQQAYDAYSKTPDDAAKQRLQMALDQTISELEADLARVKKLEKEAAKRLAKSETNSNGYLASWGSWLKQNAQSFFGSDDGSLVERYAGIAQKRQGEIASLKRLRERLEVEAAYQQKQQTERNSLLTVEAAEKNSPLARRLLDTPGTPMTVSQYCYPMGTCELSNLHDGLSGFVLQGEALSDSSGSSVSDAGDINGDGVGDLVIGAEFADPSGRSNAGKSYIIFGSRSSTAWGNGTLGLSNMVNGVRGFMLQGEAAYDRSGHSVSTAGDINGDGVDDLVIGAFEADPSGRSNAGKSYIIFGSRDSAAWSNGTLELSRMYDGVHGFVLQGEAVDDHSGASVSTAGDINGDGVDDLVIGAFLADPSGRSNAGKSYIIFGSRSSTAWGNGILELSNLINGVRGFMLQGEAADDYCGISVSNAGDINGDGVGDLVIGAYHADPNGRSDAGKSYVIFGSRSSTAWGNGILDLSNLPNGVRGFVLQGEAAGDYSGVSVSTAGDINGDGVDDLVIGAYGASPSYRSGAGKSYIIFGSRSSTAWGNGILDLSNLINGVRGFVLQGEATGDCIGYSVSAAGDANGDGVDDLVIGAYGSTSKSYIIFGSRDSTAWASGTLDLSNLVNGIRGFMLPGETTGDYSGYSVSTASDVNGDWVDDLIIGAQGAGPSFNSFFGKSYVIFGASDAQINFTANSLAIATGETVPLNTSALTLASPVLNTSHLTINVDTIEHGGFSMVDVPTVAITRFSFQNVLDRQIQFTHDSSTFSPAYRLLTNIKLLSYYSDAQINFLGYRPELNNNQLLVYQGLAITLQSADLSATDRDDNAGSLNFIISNLQHGQFNLYNTTGQLIAANLSQFNQQAIFDQHIQFVPDGSAIAPTYSVAVSDAHSTTSSRTAVISFNHAPVLNVSQIIIDQGQPTVLLPQNIAATDMETFDEDIIIEVANVTHGYFSYSSNPTFVISAFRQFPLIAGIVQFTQEGSNANVSFALRAFDGRIYSPWQMAQTWLNHKPTLQRNVSDVTVTQDKPFNFDLGSDLFNDPDGDSLVYSAQLKGGAPLPKGLEFIPPSHFQGNLPTINNYQIEVLAKDPRGLAASTDFTLESQTLRENDTNSEKSYTMLYSFSAIAVAVAGYWWWRRRVASHRRGFDLANNLRTAANLEYYNFLGFDGDIFKSKVDNFLTKLDILRPSFYKGLSSAEKESFAVCIAEILEQHGLLKPSGYNMGIYGWMFAFSVGWSQQLDFKKFESQLDDIAKEAVASWQAEENPTARWPYYSPTAKDKAKAFCCARPSRAGMFARDKVHLNQGQSVSMTDLKHQAIDVSPAGQKSESAIHTSPSLQFFDISFTAPNQKSTLQESETEGVAVEPDILSTFTGSRHTLPLLTGMNISSSSDS